VVVSVSSDEESL